MAATIDTVLAPVDSSDESETAARYAIAIAEEYGADLHLLHILDQRVVRSLDSGDIAGDTVAEQQRSFTGRIREVVDPDSDVEVTHSGAMGFSTNRLAQTPGNVILDAAEELGADFLVVPRIAPSGDPDEAIGKAALYVLEYASQPVLSV